MGGVTDEHVFHRPAAELRPFAAWATGYRQDGVPPTVHRGLPSPWLTLIVTLDDPLAIARHPDPRQAPSRHDTLLGGRGRLVVVGLWMAMFPTLRRRQRLHGEPEPLPEPAGEQTL